MRSWLGFLGFGRFLQYTLYIVRHKWYVARAGWRVADTWMERWLCLLHDNNKFHPAMWGPYARHFYNPDGSKRTKLSGDGFYDDEPDDLAFDRAWLWHIQRSKHHPQHWCRPWGLTCGHWPGGLLLEDDGGAKCLEQGCGRQYKYVLYGQGADDESMYDPDTIIVTVIEMPQRYITEMLCDWMGAGLAQGTPDTQGWYYARGHKHPMGPRTRELVEQRLGIDPRDIRFHGGVSDEPCGCCTDAARFVGSGEPPCPACGHTVDRCAIS